MANEVELGTGIPTVIQGYTVAVLLESVKIRWDDNNGILLTKMVYEQYAGAGGRWSIFHKKTGLGQPGL
jgi:hypothetical protein